MPRHRFAGSVLRQFIRSMKEQSELTPEELEAIQKRLRGKQLVSRTNWTIRQAAYVLACVVAFAVVIQFLEDTWQIVGVILAAIIASAIPEVLIDWRYGLPPRMGIGQ
jgi:hypothetical protein